MPDLKTEMNKVLNAWEQDAQQTQTGKKPYRFTATNNVSVETFNYVKNNPRSVASEIYSALEKRGFKKSSVGSLLTQFVKQEQMARTEAGKYTTLVPAYIPLKSAKKHREQIKAEAKKKEAPKPKLVSSGIAALKAEPRAKVTGVTSSAWDADTIINNIGLKQARALYDELKKIFGG